MDNAITALADSVGGDLPDPWATTVRAAARSNAARVPSALAEAVRQAVPAGESARVPVWWRLITAWQWLLSGLAVAGVVWAVVIAVGHGGKERSTLLGDTSLIPWLLVMAAAVLLLGFLTAAGCRNMALLAADRERERAARAMHERGGRRGPRPRARAPRPGDRAVRALPAGPGGGGGPARSVTRPPSAAAGDYPERTGSDSPSVRDNLFLRLYLKRDAEPSGLMISMAASTWLMFS